LGGRQDITPIPVPAGDEYFPKVFPDIYRYDEYLDEKRIDKSCSLKNFLEFYDIRQHTSGYNIRFCMIMLRNLSQVQAQPRN